MGQIWVARDASKSLDTTSPNPKPNVFEYTPRRSSAQLVADETEALEAVPCYVVILRLS